MKAFSPCHHLNDIMNAYFHPFSCSSLVTLSQGHFLYAIMNSETINISYMIYKTIFFHYTSPLASILYYTYMITQWYAFIIGDLSSTNIDIGFIYARHFLLNTPQTLYTLNPILLPPRMYLCLFLIIIFLFLFPLLLLSI